MNITTPVLTGDRTSMSISLDDGRKLSFAEYGPENGKPFILFHGSPGSRISEDHPLLYKLGIRMIYPERPGYGQSSPYPNASFRSWSEDVASLIKHLKIDTASIGGVSGGGPYALACAALIPGKVETLSLIASAAPADIPGYKENMALSNKMGYIINKYTPFLVRWVSQNFAKNLRKHPYKTIKQINQQLCPSDQNILDDMEKNGGMEVIIEHLNEAFANGVDGHVKDMALFTKKWNLPYEKITCPVHIWHGEEDTLAPLPGIKALSQLLLNVQENVIPNAGHLLMEDEKIFKLMLESIKTYETD